MNDFNGFSENLVFVLPHICTGGAEKVVIDLLTEIKRQGLSGELVVLGKKEGNDFTDKLERNHIKTNYCNVSGRLSIANYRKVSVILKRIKPSFLSVHLDKRYSLMWSALNKCKIAYTVHSAPVRINDFITKILFKILMKLNLIKFVAVSDIIGKQMTEVFSLHSNSVTSIINPVSIGNVEVSKSQGKIVSFVNVARLTAIKNHKLLIDAFSEAHRKNDNIFLEIAGSGEEYVNLEEQIKEKKAKDYIKLLGEIKDVETLLSNKDVFLLTSDSEALPISILEAMAAGLPVISSNVGGISEIVSDNGILFERGNKEKLTDAILFLASNAEVRVKMSHNSKEHVKNYSVDNVLQKYLKVFEELLYD